MASGKKATQSEKDNVNARFNAMKNAAGGTKDKTNHERAIATDATFEEKAELVREAIATEPGLDLQAAADVAEEFYDAETSGREAARRALTVVADGDPRDAPDFPELPREKRTKEWTDPPDPTPEPPEKE